MPGLDHLHDRSRVAGPREHETLNPPDDDPDEHSDVIRRAAAEIAALPVDARRFITGYSYVLARVAYADRDFNDAELESMVRSLTDVGHLTENQAILVVEVARNMALLYGSSEDFVVTTEFARSTTREQREDLLRTAFAVGAADAEISAPESAVLEEIGKELGFRSDEIASIRAERETELEGD